MARVHEVVVSGVAGVFPDCDDFEELSYKLLSGIDMVTSDNCRWTPGEIGVPSATGKIRNPEEFDMTLFGIPRKLAEITDPNTRLSVSQAFRAICDSGTNPSDISGSNTAVFMSSFMSETEDQFLTQNADLGTYGILANSRTMQANRISFFLNLKGPSNVLDATWCGGTQALLCAYDMVSTGMANAAIVGASSLIFKPQVSVHYQAMGRLSEDGVTRSFSSDASGYARSEACVAFFLQRAQDARRSYGTVLGAFTLHYGIRDTSFLDFSANEFRTFLKNVYNKLAIDPKDVCYYEAAGAASKNLDAKELNAVAEIFLSGRENPLMIGSVKSNLGHTEGASSLVSLAKALIALDRGVVPPNLHYSSPNEAVPALMSGHLQVVTRPTDLQGDVVAVNDIGLSGGTMSHIVIRKNPKTKPPLHDGFLPPHIVPRLVLLSDRNETNLKINLKSFETLSVDDEYATLINCLNKTGIKGHLLRAFSVWNGTKNSYNQIVKCSASKKSERRLVCFVFSGMGSQWPAMGRSLLRFPIFEKTIQKCHKFLRQKGINLMKILTSFDDPVFDSILNCFVGIAAVQIALVDVLRTIGVEPDMMIGHSVGELGCAYADGCLTMEQTLLSAWARGKASTDATLVKGTMAAVGIGYAAIQNRLPPTIDVACHNSSCSSTLSGPVEDMERFVTKLRGEAIFAKLVNVANIAYHSRYIKAAGPFLLNYLKPIIPDPKRRSPKWLSTSIPEDLWDSTLASHCSAEYFVNNLLSPVLFEEVARKIPKDAIMIEIAPHGLLQAIIRKSHSKAIHIPLTSRFDEDNLMFLLSAIGKIYANGLPVDIEKLYDPVVFPVSRGTPPLSNFFGWQTTEFLKLEVNKRNDRMACWKDVRVDLKKEKYSPLASHKIRGRTYLPKSFIVHKVVKHFMKLKNLSDATIEFQNLKFRNDILLEGGIFEMNVQLQQGTGSFCVVDGNDGSIIANGKLVIVDSKMFSNSEIVTLKGEQFEIEGKEIFELFESYGLSLKNSFANLKKIIFCKNGLRAILIWDGRFVEFLNGLLALIAIFKTKSSDSLQTMGEIGRLFVNFSTIRNWSRKDVEVVYDEITNILYCESFQISLAEPTEFRRFENLPFETKRFIPNSGEEIDPISAVKICHQIIVENIPETIKCIVVCIGKSKFSEILAHLSKSDDRIQLWAFTSSDEILHLEIHTLRGNTVWLVSEHISTDSAKFVSTFALKTFVLSKKMGDYAEIFSFDINSDKYSLKLLESKKSNVVHIIQLSDDYRSKLMAKLIQANDDNRKFGQSYSVCLFGKIENQSEVIGIVEDSKSLPHSHLLRFVFTNRPISETELRKIVDNNLKTNVLWDGVLGSIRAFTENIPNSSHCSQSADFILANLTSSSNKPNGNLNSKNIVGYAISGIMGIGKYDFSKKSFMPDNFLKWKIPENWTKSQAMTAPLLYSMASYIIDSNNAEIVDNSILINNGLLPLSRAIISMLENADIEIYVSVYGDEKAKILKQFPFLKEDNIVDCSTNSFHVNVLRKTGGRGVYKVINTFEEENMVKSCVRCVGVLGVYIQVSEGPMAGKFEMGMSVFLTEVLAIGITTETLVNLSADEKTRVRDMVEKYVYKGSIRPFMNPNDSKVDDCSGEAGNSGLKMVGNCVQPIGNIPKPTDVGNSGKALVSNSAPEIVDSKPAILNFESAMVGSGSAMVGSGPAMVACVPVMVDSGPAMVDSGPAMVDSEPGTVGSGVQAIGVNSEQAKIAYSGSAMSGDSGIAMTGITEFATVNDPEPSKFSDFRTTAADITKLGIVENSDQSVDSCSASPITGGATTRTVGDSGPEMGNARPGLSTTGNFGQKSLCNSGSGSVAAGHFVPSLFSKSPLENYMIINERKSGSIIWVEAVSWMLKMGARSVFALLRNASSNKACKLRLHFLKDKYKHIKLTFLSDEAFFESSSTENVSRCLDSIRPEKILFLSECQNSNLIELLSNQVDFLKIDCGFICLGLGGESICESRCRRGLRSLCIRMKSSDDETRTALEYLENLYNKSDQNPVVTIENVSNNISGVTESANSTLPCTITELQALLSTSTGRAKFVEIPSKSPRCQFSKEIQPLYVFPGLRVLKLRQIVRKLFHPALEARYSEKISNIPQLGKEFSEQISASDQNMYTILAEGYGGILALQVASYLETMGKIVRVVLVDSRPKRLLLEASKILNDPNSYSVKGPSFENSSKAGSSHDEKTVSRNLEELLSPQERSPEDITLRSAKILQSRLQSVVSAPSPDFKIKRQIYSLNTETDNPEHSGLEQFCEHHPIVRIFSGETEEGSVCKVAEEINTLVLHNVKDIAYLPSEDFLESNFIKPNLRRAAIK